MHPDWCSRMIMACSKYGERTLPARFRSTKPVALALLARQCGRPLTNPVGRFPKVGRVTEPSIARTLQRYICQVCVPGEEAASTICGRRAPLPGDSASSESLHEEVMYSTQLTLPEKAMQSASSRLLRASCQSDRVSSRCSAAVTRSPPGRPGKNHVMSSGGDSPCVPLPKNYGKPDFVIWPGFEHAMCCKSLL